LNTIAAPSDDSISGVIEGPKAARNPFWLSIQIGFVLVDSSLQAWQHLKPSFDEGFAKMTMLT